jgi:GNAT superfamily N-acetyltransferase
MKSIVDTNIKDFKIRTATREDIPLVLQFIKELAVYEKMLDEVIATEETLEESLFEKKVAEVVFGEYKGEAVGFALFFHNFSTFIGRPGLYLEDIFIRPEARGKGFGKTMILYLANVAKERNCGRMEWVCLDWNAPSIEFYKSIGAIPMDEWTVYRAKEDVLKKLADEFKGSNSSNTKDLDNL